MTFILFFLSALCFLAALHPFITYPFSLLLLRRRLFSPLRLNTHDAPGETYALCVCAYNEEAIITQKIENMLELRRVLPGLEILVYVDAASDRTAEIARNYEGRITLHISPVRHGKTYGMNLLVSQASASIILFTDANVIFDCETFRSLPDYFSDPQVGCVCGHLRYSNEEETVTAKNGSLYWRMEERIKQLESDTGSIIGADGSIYAIRKRLHQPPPEGMVDDMYISLSILCDGYRVVRAPDILVYEKSVTSSHEEFKRKIRIACLAFSAHRWLWPRLRELPALDLYKYVSHKLLRWFVIYWLALSALFGVAAIVNAGLAREGLAAALLAALALSAGRACRWKPALQIADIFVAFTGTGIGVWRAMKGDSFKTWAPATSMRNTAGINSAPTLSETH